MGLHIPGYGDFRRSIKKMTWFDWIILVLLTCVPAIVGIVLACIFRQEESTTKPLQKPMWAPPGWLFGLISVGLYLFIGFASYRLWKASSSVSVETVGIWMLYIFQLCLNWSWLPLVFRGGYLAGGLIAISACCALVISCVIVSFAHSKIVSFMFILYLVWVSFVVAISYNIVLLNGAIYPGIA